MALNVITAATEDPVTYQELKASHLRVTGSEDDAYIDALIKAATRRTEIETGMSLITRTLRLTLDEFPCGRVIQLEKPPLLAVASVKYLDTAGVLQTLSPSLYTVDIRSSPGRVILNSGGSWPSTSWNGNAVEIQYTSGFGIAKDVPEDLKHGIRFLVALWYRNREPSDSIDMKPVPLTYEWLVGPYRYR